MLGGIHHCFANTEQQTVNYLRKHFPVAPRCNIKCRYCEIKICAHYHLHRPSYTGRILSPQEALLNLKETLEYYKNKSPFTCIVAVSGPGDPLYNPQTFEFFQMVKEEFPDAWLCTCTNGLLLPSKVSELVKLGVKTLTVTVNALDPQILAKIVSFVIIDNIKLSGIEGAKVLIKNQIEGIEAAIKNGLKVKINTVLVPDINEQECIEIAKFFAKKGAYIMNIMPLIPGGEFKNIRRPSCDKLRDIREEAEQYIKQFRRCMQCRADAEVASLL